MRFPVVTSPVMLGPPATRTRLSGGTAAGSDVPGLRRRPGRTVSSLSSSTEVGRIVPVLREAEGVVQAPLSVAGEPHSSPLGGVADPVEFEQSAGQRGAEGTGEVVTLLGPVDAVADAWSLP